MILDELNELSNRQYVSPLKLAGIYVAPGNNENGIPLPGKSIRRALVPRS
jgi:hypothetical protein